MTSSETGAVTRQTRTYCVSERAVERLTSGSVERNFKYLVFGWFKTSVNLSFINRMNDAQSRPRREYTPKPKPIFDFGDDNHSNGGYTSSMALPPSRNSGKKQLSGSKSSFPSICEDHILQCLSQTSELLTVQCAQLLSWRKCLFMCVGEECVRGACALPCHLPAFLQLTFFPFPVTSSEPSFQLARLSFGKPTLCESQMAWAVFCRFSVCGVDDAVYLHSLWCEV